MTVSQYFIYTHINQLSRPSIILTLHQYLSFVILQSINPPFLVRMIFNRDLLLAISASLGLVPTLRDNPSNLTVLSSPSHDGFNSSPYVYPSFSIVPRLSPNRPSISLRQTQVTDHTRAHHWNMAVPVAYASDTTNDTQGTSDRLSDRTGLLYKPQIDRLLDRTGLLYKPQIPRHILARWSQLKESLILVSLPFKWAAQYLVASREQLGECLNGADVCLEPINQHFVTKWNQLRELFNLASLIFKRIVRYIVTSRNQVGECLNQADLCLEPTTRYFVTKWSQSRTLWASHVTSFFQGSKFHTNMSDLAPIVYQK